MVQMVGIVKNRDEFVLSELVFVGSDTGQHSFGVQIHDIFHPQCNNVSMSVAVLGEYQCVELEIPWDSPNGVGEPIWHITSSILDTGQNGRRMDLYNRLAQLALAFPVCMAGSRCFLHAFKCRR